MIFLPSEERGNPRALTWSGAGSSSPAPGESRLGILKADVPRGWLLVPRSTRDLPTKERRIQVARESQSQSGAEDDAKNKTTRRGPWIAEVQGVQERRLWGPQAGRSASVCCIAAAGDRTHGPRAAGSPGPRCKRPRGASAREAALACSSGRRQCSRDARTPARPGPGPRTARDLSAAQDRFS